MTVKPWNLDDAQHRLAHSKPLDARLRRAEITYKGSVRAVLNGPDADDLKARAHRFAAGQNWRRAVVTVT